MNEYVMPKTYYRVYVQEQGTVVTTRFEADFNDPTEIEPWIELLKLRGHKVLNYKVSLITELSIKFVEVSQ